VDNSSLESSSLYNILDFDERNLNSIDISVRGKINEINNYYNNDDVSIKNKDKETFSIELKKLNSNRSRFKIPEKYKEDLNNDSFNSNISNYNIYENSGSSLFKKNITRNKKILIVDDNKFLNDAVKNILEKVLKESNQNFELIQLSDGVDIIKSVIEDQRNGNLISCVLTDENMEYVNGSQAFVFLKDLEKSSKILNVKFITITSHESKEKVDFLINIGIDLVLEKPLTKSILLSALQELKIL
jgi:CheY-like chemotaxis protein